MPHLVVVYSCTHIEWWFTVVHTLGDGVKVYTHLSDGVQFYTHYMGLKQLTDKEAINLAATELQNVHKALADY